MAIYTACCWCHDIVPFGMSAAAKRGATCKRCGHNPYLPRLNCDCSKCGARRAEAARPVEERQVEPERVTADDLAAAEELIRRSLH